MRSLGISYINTPISNHNKTTPYQVILNLKRFTEEKKDKNIFISIEKDINSNYILFYKKKFHNDASTIANFLLVVIQK